MAAPTRTDEAYQQLLALVDSMDVRGSDRLPTEQDLTEQLGFSRTVLRDALSRMRADGRIVSKRGSGTYVVRDARTEMVRLFPITTLAELLELDELRLGIESEAVALAAQRATDEDNAAIQHAQDELLAAMAAGSYGAAEDANFHLRLATASRNAAIIGSVRSLNVHIRRWVSAREQADGFSNVDRRDIVGFEHNAIIEAVKAHDADAARAALRRHLINGRLRTLAMTQQLGRSR